MELINGVRKLARELGVNPSTIYRWIEKENFPDIQVGDKKRAFDPEDVRAWIDSKKKNR